jgi:benzoate/toluate 1,2-dioxygenase subunit beta
MNAQLHAEPAAAIAEQDRRAIEQFIYRETRFADECRYTDWENLWDEDGSYWVPIGDGNYDRTQRVSIIDDTRSRIASRIKQLETGKRYAHVPASWMRRVLSNVEIERSGDTEFEVGANFLLVELVMSSTRQQRLWAGRVLYRLRERNGALKMFFKKVTLINAAEPIPNLPPLI